MCNPPTDIRVKAPVLAKDATTTTTTGTPALKTISRSDLASHNSPSNAWCAVHGKVLSITEFSKRHPGGDAILLAAGKDATVLFETYHPRGVPEALVKKLQVGQMAAGAFPDSFYSWDSEFYRTLKRRVVARLEERKLHRRGSIEIWVKAAFLLIGFWYSLYRMCVAPTFVGGVAWSVSMGSFAAFIGTCIQHDGNHGAFAYSRAANKLAGWTLDMIGASAFTWELQHMLGHHPYTNVLDTEEDDRKNSGREDAVPMGEKDQESDPDVFSSFPLMRMHPYHTPEWYHAYQHLYAPLLFAGMTLAKVFQQDFEVATSQRLYHIDAVCRYGSNLNVLRFWFMKFLTACYMIGAPIYFHGPLKGAALFFVGHCACGELLATMFIVNHVIEGVSYANKTTGGVINATSAGDSAAVKVGGKPATAAGDTPMELTRKLAAERSNGKKDGGAPPDVHFNDWAAVQCQTSVNWSPGSWFWNHFSGGLSHQIEHHLFPSICHTNYCYINDVVQKTCEEYGVPYQSEPNLWTAYGKMINQLKWLGSVKME